MSKFVVKSCTSLAHSYYADGREISGECMKDIERKCLDIENCYLKQIARNLMKVVEANLCENCDGCGYAEGCLDTDCGTYQAHKCLELLNIEGAEDDR